MRDIGVKRNKDSTFPKMQVELASPQIPRAPVLLSSSTAEVGEARGASL